MRLLFIVEDVSTIKERGVIAIGKLADPERSGFRLGEPVEVRRRDGSVVRTAITRMPMGMLTVGSAEVLLGGISKSDVQTGDEIWFDDGGRMS
jgi:hypothetical protein